MSCIALSTPVEILGVEVGICDYLVLVESQLSSLASIVL